MSGFGQRLPRPFVEELQVSDEWINRLRKVFKLHAAGVVSSVSVTKAFNVVWYANGGSGLELVK